MDQPIAPRRRLGGLLAAALLAMALAGCVGGGPGGTPTAAPSPTTPPSETPSPGGDEPRFLISCFYPDGSEVATFTGLEEAWASTNYVRIDTCDAAVALPEGFELTPDEQAVAEVAAGDLPDADPTDLYLRTLAACVRLNAAELAGEPASVLEATRELCPEAPQAGLIDAELSARPPAA